MKAAAVMLVMSVFVVGCGGGDDDPLLSAEETAQEWVEAVNAEDYDRACDLSVFETKSDCLDVMKEKPFGSDLRVDGFSSGESEGTDGEASFGISSAEGRKPRGKGWTGYAPLDAFDVERHGEEYKVHFEYSIIR